MKANPLARALLVLLAVAVQLLAQNSNTDNAPSWADTQPVSSSTTNATIKPWERYQKPSTPAPHSSAWQPPEGDEIIKGTKIPRWDDTTPLSTKTPKPIVLPDQIKTKNGRVYEGVKLVAKNDFEITIRCFDKEDSMELENIRLADLPEDLQKQLGYDPKKSDAEEARQKEREKLFAAPKPSPSERRWMPSLPDVPLPCRYSPLKPPEPTR